MDVVEDIIKNKFIFLNHKTIMNKLIGTTEDGIQSQDSGPFTSITSII